MKEKSKRLLTLFIGWPLSFISLFFIAKTVAGKSDTLTTIVHINPLLLLFGIVCFAFFYILRGYLWHQILIAKGYSIPVKESLLLWSIAELNRYVPGNIWSFIGRVHLFSRKAIPQKTVISTMITEAIFFILGCSIVSLFCLYYILFVYIQSQILVTVMISIVTGILILITFLFIYSQKNRKILQKTKISFLNHALPDLSSKKIFHLLLLSFFANFFFGLGTYLTITSLVFLTPELLFVYIGFFVLSLLLGYLTVITPMGLGVRESIISYGLATQISLSFASTAALLARVVLIISELVSLLLFYIWAQIRNKHFSSVENYFQKNIYLIFLFIAMIIYTSYFTSASFLKHDNFYTGRFDLGNMTQTVWNTAHGRIFEFTDPDGTEIISRLVFHADFILILLAPLQFLWASPKMLLLTQSIIVSFGALFVYLIAKNILKQPSLALLISITFLVNPSVNYTDLFDFHAVTLATTFLLGTIYFLLKRQYVWFFVFAILSALTKEQIWLIVMLFGLYIFFFDKKRVFGAAILLGSFATFYYLIWYAIPHLRGSNHFALSYYSDFGTTPELVIKNVLFSPLKTLNTAFKIDQINYLLQLFAPLGFLSLFSPLFLLFAAPDLFLNLLSSNTQLHQIYFQYTATITPFLFTSAIFGIAFLRKLFPKIPVFVFCIYLCITTTLTAYAYGPLPGALHPSLDMFTKPQPKKDVIKNVLRKIPKNLKVAATNNLGSHLSNRKHIFTIPVGVDKADVLAFLLNDQYAQPSLAAQITMVQQLKNNPNYVIIYEEDDFIVFKKVGVNWNFSLL